MQFLSYPEDSCRPLSRFHHHRSLTIPRVDENTEDSESDYNTQGEREKGRMLTAKTSLLEVLLFLFLFKYQKKTKKNYLPSFDKRRREGGGVTKESDQNLQAPRQQS